MRAPNAESSSLAEADGEIGAFGNEILPFVGHRQLDVQQWMQRQEFSQTRDDLPHAVHDGHCDADGSAQRVDTARGVFRVLDVGEDLACAREEERPGVSHGDAARGPQQQLDVETRLQLADDAGHRGLGQAEFSGSPGKTAAFGGPDEHRHFLKPVTHLYSK